MLSRLMKKSIIISLLCVTAIGVFSKSSWNLSVYSFGLQSSSPCACLRCLTVGDPWFRELLNSSPQPFLSKTYTTSEDDFNWWKMSNLITAGQLLPLTSATCTLNTTPLRMQGENRNFTFYKSTVDKLFQIFPPVPDVVEFSPDRCRTCAVVGNSGNLKRSHYGPLIDMHDIVIRMNRGRTKGYETDVGTKTTHHVMYPESAKNLDNTTHLVLFPFKISDFLWLLQKFNSGKNSTVTPKTIANKDLVMILNPALMRYVHETWLGKKGKYPSTGFLTLALSLQICDEVSVFGFGADSDGNWDHYYEVLKQKKLRTGPHAGMHEYDIIQQLQDQKKIVFFKGF